MRFKSVILVALVAVSCSTPPPPPQPSPQPSSGFVVSPERKQASLVEIKSLVAKLNAIIDRKAFSEWVAYLDDAYLKTYSDPVRLHDYSLNSPFLKANGIKLTSLEDYFTFVVAPSRAKVVVDDISFVDENRVQVWTVVDNERLLLYLLKLYGNQWKISSW
jgi:hypothetical protein